MKVHQRELEKNNGGVKISFVNFLEMIHPSLKAVSLKEVKLCHKGTVINTDYTTNILGKYLISVLLKVKVLKQDLHKGKGENFYYIYTAKFFRDKISIQHMTAAKVPTTFPMIYPPKL